MGTTDIVLLIWGLICFLLIGQGCASGYIGNRFYSAWYETHFLIEKKGVTKLIYFKPKHFGRYTLYEVFSFFFSFLQIILLGILSILLILNILSQSAFRIIISSIAFLIIFAEIFIVIINDIGSCKDKKKRFYLATGEREITELEDLILDKQNKQITKAIKLSYQMRYNSYFTIHNLRASYYRRINEAKKDPIKTEKINKEYIEYFKNIKKLVVEKENKDGSLVLKIKK